MKMDINDYQRDANRTLVTEPGFELTPAETMIVWNTIGLSGEAGEVAELVKKGLFHKHGLDHESLKKELGDVLWYVAALASEIGVDLSEIADANLDKLKARYPDGYSGKASMERADA